jgi:hypothetical protein
MSVDGLPNGERLWPSANPGVGTLVETDLTSAEAGLTVRLGAELARVGIRYLILPGAVAPDLPGVQVSLSAPPPPNLVKTLQVQSDFRELPTEGGVLAFEDTAWSAADSPAPGAVVTRAMAGHTTLALIRELGLAAGLLAVSLAVAEGVARRRKRRPLSPESEAPPGDAAILDLGPSDGGAPSPAGSSAEDPADRPEPAPSTLS